MRTWADILAAEQQQTYFQDILGYVEQQRQSGTTVYPPNEHVFSAFELTPLADVKVVLLGQDPYHGPEQAHGLCFSVLPGIKPPPSLANIYKELATDIEGFQIPQHGYLARWAEQGVLMLNTVLTVEQGHAHSHAKIGWETFTDAIIRYLNEHCSGLVFLLWGSHAQRKGKAIDLAKHHVLAGPHPSPLSAYRGFFGCGHFSQTNRLLEAQKHPPIDWQI